MTAFYNNIVCTRQTERVHSVTWTLQVNIGEWVQIGQS